MSCFDYVMLLNYLYFFPSENREAYFIYAEFSEKTLKDIRDYIVRKQFPNGNGSNLYLPISVTFKKTAIEKRPIYSLKFKTLEIIEGALYMVFEGDKFFKRRMKYIKNSYENYRPMVCISTDISSIDEEEIQKIKFELFNDLQVEIEKESISCDYINPF